VPILINIGLTCVAQCHLGLAAVNTSAGTIAVIIAVAAYVLRAIRETAALAAGVQRIGAFIPAAQVLIVITRISVLSTLNFSLLCCLKGKLLLVGPLA